MKDEEMAEEYLTRTVCQGCRNICEGDCAYAKPVRRAFLAGYHECQKEHEWHYVKDGLPKESKKEHEWHYVKDGNPEELQDVLCFVIHNEHRYFLQGYLRDGRWVLSPLGTYLNNKDVIAWKEIVPPELPKENE